jgi:hypothetical protein
MFIDSKLKPTMPFPKANIGFINGEEVSLIKYKIHKIKGLIND